VGFTKGVDKGLHWQGTIQTSGLTDGKAERELGRQATELRCVFLGVVVLGFVAWDTDRQAKMAKR